ncbi:hypothetical protein Vadar_014948 [Vaccinium darrowii]|uniref:Uncharacterized protein n=1 Tax=Vaccinium darrowii TaxID=229202 RepID=A0ACB7ZCR6_9ERIC|nr:hypothetical protein Vadar_014948 [Vaccinium darrowii]
MVLVLVNLIFSAVTAVSNLLSRVILSVVAFLLVLAIRAFKLFAGAIQDLLEQLCVAIKSYIEYSLPLLVDGLSNLVSTLFDFIKEGISSAVVATGSALGVLMQQTGDSIGVLLKGLAQVLEGFLGMFATVITDLWNNLKDATGYVTKNA